MSQCSWVSLPCLFVRDEVFIIISSPRSFEMLSPYGIRISGRTANRSRE